MFDAPSPFWAAGAEVALSAEGLFLGLVQKSGHSGLWVA